MSDLRQQRDAARTERDQLRQENHDLRNILGDIDPTYASAYSDLCALALNGLRRPDDLGGPITLNTAKSRPPSHHPAAYHHRNEERRDQRHRAARLRGLVEAMVDDNQLQLANIGPALVGPTQTR